MMRKKKGWKKVCDYEMRNAYGEIDYDRKKIRINPHKGEVIETILHEEIHKEFPKLTEVQTERLAQQRLKKLSLKEQMSLMRKYLPRKHQAKLSNKPIGLTFVKGRKYKVLYRA